MLAAQERILLTAYLFIQFGVASFVFLQEILVHGGRNPFMFADKLSAASIFKCSNEIVSGFLKIMRVMFTPTRLLDFLG